MEKVEIGQRMKKKRSELALTQVEVSKKSGISSQYYGLIEKGANSPSIEVLSRIADTLQVSLLFLLNARIEDTELRVENERKRLEKLFQKMPTDKLELAEGLIIQAARLRVLLDDNWKDILENGEYEKFKQGENQVAYDRKRPIVENYDNRDKTYQSIIRQLDDLLPQNAKTNKKNKLLGRK